jgi:hypothetical protein
VRGFARRAAELRREAAGRDRAILEVLRVLVRRDAWMRARLVDLAQRLRALQLAADLPIELPPAPPAWPPLEIPPELLGLLED